MTRAALSMRKAAPLQAPVALGLILLVTIILILPF
jgi:hypothetical protein